MEKDYKKRNFCASCGNGNLIPILNLGDMPLANGFLSEQDIKEKKEEKKFPLSLYFCKECSLLQIVDVISPNVLFDEYDYITSASDPLIPHFEEMARTLFDEFISSEKDLFVDIGGNDGTLLNAIKDKCRVLNVDPAKNITPLASRRNIETLTNFFSLKCAKYIVEKYGTAKVAVGNNVMAHIADIKDAFLGVHELIGADGVFVMEAHWVGNLIGEGGFDQIYHEHLYYYSLTSLRNLVKSVGLDVFRVELCSLHGQSMRVFISRSRKPEPSVFNLLAKEHEMKLDKEDAFTKFGEKVENNKKELRKIVFDIKKAGEHIVAYGAPAKGNTLLNYFGFDSSVIDYAIDTTPMKQGKFTPGVHIPIYPPTKIQENPPQYFILLAWNYADSIIKKENLFCSQGGKFILPVPIPKIL